MHGLKRLAGLAFLSALAVVASARAGPAPPTPAVIADLDLSKPFDTRSAWRLTASQGPSVDDPAGAGDQAPGSIHLCLAKDARGSCEPQLLETMAPTSPDDPFAEPHYLNKVQIVHGASGLPLLLVQTASVFSGDGDRRVFTQALAYRRGPDRFARVYDHVTGTNNNEEVRFIEKGPLKGDIISAEPAEKAPFNYWVTINVLAAGHAYRQVLRYRSATRYGDGNRLAVIDSEMANIERRLGLWRPGSPLPLPSGPCPKPRLTHTELWCD
jgi:hypothetical protein